MSYDMKLWIFSISIFVEFVNMLHLHFNFLKNLICWKTKVPIRNEPRLSAVPSIFVKHFSIMNTKFTSCNFFTSFTRFNQITAMSFHYFTNVWKNVLYLNHFTKISFLGTVSSSNWFSRFSSMRKEIHFPPSSAWKIVYNPREVK